MNLLSKFKNFLRFLPNEKTWFIINFFTPLFPYLIAVSVRSLGFIGGNNFWNNLWIVIDPSDVALFLTLTSLFICSSIDHRDLPPGVDIDLNKALESKALWKMFAIVSFILFILLEYTNAIYCSRLDKSLLLIMNVIRVYIIIFLVFLYFVAKRTQATFDLKA